MAKREFSPVKGAAVQQKPILLPFWSFETSRETCLVYAGSSFDPIEATRAVCDVDRMSFVPYSEELRRVPASRSSSSAEVDEEALGVGVAWQIAQEMEGAGSLQAARLL
jgi:hypothetical protein